MFKKLINYRRDEKLIRQFFSDLPKTTHTRGRVLQFVGISSMFLTPVEILIYHLLKQKGFEVDYLVYDESIPIFETVTHKTTDPATAPRRNWRVGKSRLKAGSVSYFNIPLSDQAKKIVDSLEDLDAILKFVFEGVEFGNIVQGTLCRYYQANSFGADAETVSRKMLLTSLSNYFCVQQRQAKYNYEFMMFSHGINITWQPVADFCRSQAVPFVCYDRAKIKEHGNFNLNQSSADWSFDSAWIRFQDRTLTDEEKRLADDYLSARELQEGDVFAFNTSKRASNLANEKTRLGIPLEKKCVTFFSNLIWDAANVSRDIAFTSFLECMTQSIEYFRDRTDVQILIRPHPAETLIGTKAGYWNLILEHFGPSLPDNVSVISADDNVNSFTVIDMTQVGVVNTSTVGLEMAIMGKQALLVAETHYRNKGFTNDITSPQHFFETIENSLEKPILTDQQQELAKKYFYMMMFLYQKHLPVRYENDVFQGYSAASFGELSETEPLLQVISGLTDGHSDDFVRWPPPPTQ
jgi:hypothetical protein